MLPAGMALGEKNGLTREVVQQLWSTMVGGKIPSGTQSSHWSCCGIHQARLGDCAKGTFPQVLRLALCACLTLIK